VEGHIEGGVVMLLGYAHGEQYPWENDKPKVICGVVEIDEITSIPSPKIEAEWHKICIY
jgi:hypothetical protein